MQNPEDDEGREDRSAALQGASRRPSSRSTRSTSEGGQASQGDMGLRHLLDGKEFQKAVHPNNSPRRMLSATASGARTSSGWRRPASFSRLCARRDHAGHDRFARPRAAARTRSPRRWRKWLGNAINKDLHQSGELERRTRRESSARRARRHLGACRRRGFGDAPAAAAERDERASSQLQQRHRLAAAVRAPATIVLPAAYRLSAAPVLWYAFITSI